MAGKAEKLAATLARMPPSWLWQKDAASLINAALVEERQECAKAYRARLEKALAQLPEKRQREPHIAGYAEAIEDMIDMLRPSS